jgi:Zn-dependent peptidase ImmA (M78 family)
VEVPITPSVLKWAIAESGYTLPEVSEVVEVGEETLKDWLAERSKPSLGQVKDLARFLHRQVATFLLPSPPVTPQISVKFRNPLGGGSRPLNPTERRYLRRARRVQDAYAWLSSELERGPVDLPQFTLSYDADDAATALRTRLGVSLPDQRKWKTASVAFDAWREALEGLGILVVMFPLGEDSCRGFSLWHESAPLVAVNSEWRDEARIFTMFHELGHLVTRTNSACAVAVSTTGDKGDRTERWCERFAASILIPARALGEIGTVSDVTSLSNLARKLKVSLSAMALRLIKLNKAKWSLFHVVPKRADAKPKGGGGGGTRTRTDVQGDRLGRRATSIFVDAVRSEVLSPSEALSVLDIPRDDFERLVHGPAPGR